MKLRLSLLLSITPLVADPLPSWNPTPAKQSIIDFVAKTTTPGSPEYVDPAERIATFDNDGCLWSEQPIYFQAVFIADRIKALAPQHPEWKSTEPFASILRGEPKKALAGGETALLELAMATHMETSKCWSGRPPARGPALDSSCITTMLDGNSPTTGNHTSANCPAVSTRDRNEAGKSSA